MLELSSLQKERLRYSIPVPTILKNLHEVVVRSVGSPVVLSPVIQKLFPCTGQAHLYRLERGRASAATPCSVGVLFSGGQASGGHNVVIGLYEALHELHPQNRLIGFLDGPEGLIRNRTFLLDAKVLERYRNQGGFDLLGSGRVKITTEEQFLAVLQTAQQWALDAIVIIGGDDSNTNAAFLAEWFVAHGHPTRFVGIPKTIDGDLRSDEIELSFGFDTACKVYSEAIGNIARDALSAKKYTHFIKLMGRSASHVTLECALQTQPNLALIGEEVAARALTLQQVVNQVADVICARSAQGKNYGVILLPEGLVEFIPDLVSQLSSDVKRDAHGNVLVSQIETEHLLISKVQQELSVRKKFRGLFSPQAHFLGYEGRCSLPSNFDVAYAYALGRLAAIAVREKITGGVCAIQGLLNPPEQWDCSVEPVVQLMGVEQRAGVEKVVIRKTLVDLKGFVFQRFTSVRQQWVLEDCYMSPGPMQFFGPKYLTDRFPESLLLNYAK